MTYGAGMHGKMGGYRGRETQETVEQRMKRTFLQEYIGNRQLSWTVALFSGRDRWPMDRYDARINEHGQLVIADREFDMEIHLYAAAGVDWHSLRAEYKDDEGEWCLFHPTAQYNAWQKRREAELNQAAE